MRASTILTTLARRAYRRPATAQDVERADGVLRGRPPAAARSRTASSWRCGGCWRARSSSCAPRRNRPTCRRASAYRITDLELASRLSFFLWSSIPDDELITLASQGQAEQPRRARAAGAAHARRPAVGRAGRTTSPQQLLYLRNLPATSPDGVFYPDWDDELRQAFQARDGAVLREHHARGSQRRRSADRRLHVRQRAARAALRHPERLRIAVPPRDARAGARLPPRAARQGQLSVGHLDAEFPDVAGQARRVGAREHPRDAAAGAAAERAAARGLDRRAAERC